MPTKARQLPARTIATLMLAAFVAAACAPGGGARSPTSMSTSPTTTAEAAPTSATSPTGLSQPPSDAPRSAATSGRFPFTAEAITGFYEGQGLTCNPPAPSTTAAGWTATTCVGADDAGRPVAIGVITDEDGELGAGFATVTALPDEEVLEPTDAIDSLSGFLGAMLGEEAATEKLPWLASHLGDDYAETTAGEVTVATYAESPDDPTRIYVEVDGPAYLAAPPPD
jgi:hypothetical protein